jgi:predicted nuclease with TOPRIM domain
MIEVSRHLFYYGVILSILSQCAPVNINDCDPSAGGFVRGLECLGDDGYRKYIANKEAELNSVRQKNAVLADQYDSLSKQKTEMTKELDSIKGQIRHIDADIDRLLVEIDRLIEARQKGAELSNRLYAMGNLFDKLSKEFEQMSRQIQQRFDISDSTRNGYLRTLKEQTIGARTQAQRLRGLARDLAVATALNAIPVRGNLKIAKRFLEVVWIFYQNFSV